MSAPTQFTAEEERLKDAAAAVKQAREALDATNEESRAFRTQFFERLTLFNGAALAASVTLLGFFFNHQTKLLHRGELEAAWWVMLLAMASGLTRNFSFTQYLWYAHFEQYAAKKAEQQGLFAEVTQNTKSLVVDKYSFEPVNRKTDAAAYTANKEGWQKNRQKALKRERIYEKSAQILQYVTPVLTLLGLALLVVFTVANLP